jgi:hypothetical protein
MSAPIFEGTTPLISDRYIITLTAGEDLPVGVVVEITADWTVKKTTSATASSKVMGITLTSAKNGGKVSVIARGLARATAYGSISAGDQIASAPAGAVQTYATKDTCAIGNALAAATSGGTAYVVFW